MKKEMLMEEKRRGRKREWEEKRRGMKSNGGREEKGEEM